MARLRTNFVSGTLSLQMLTATTVMNSVGLSELEVVGSPDVAIIVLDPLQEFGDPEIIHVTLHAGAATTATVTRGQEGTTARDHPAGTTWKHAPTEDDFDDSDFVTFPEMTEAQLPAGAPTGTTAFQSNDSASGVRGPRVKGTGGDTDWKHLTGEVVDVVRDFGAKGDGVFDNTSRISAAAQALNAAGGGVLWFPPGIYAVAGTDSGDGYNNGAAVYSNVAYRGAGRASQLLATGPRGQSILGGNNESLKTDVSIKDLYFRGNHRWHEASANGTGIRIAYFDNLTVEDCWFENFVQAAFVGATNALLNSKNLFFRHNYVDGDNWITHLGVCAYQVEGLFVNNNYFERVSRALSSEIGARQAYRVRFKDNTVKAGALSSLDDPAYTGLIDPAPLGSGQATYQGVLLSATLTTGKIEDIVVADNHFIDGVGHTANVSNDIYIAGVSTSELNIKNITLSGNVCSGLLPGSVNDVPIRLRYCDTVNSVGNTISDPRGNMTSAYFVQNTRNGNFGPDVFENGASGSFTNSYREETTIPLNNRFTSVSSTLVPTLVNASTSLSRIVADLTRESSRNKTDKALIVGTANVADGGWVTLSRGAKTAFIDNDHDAHIYTAFDQFEGTSGAGELGALILQPRTSAGRVLVLANGITTTGFGLTLWSNREILLGAPTIGAVLANPLAGAKLGILGDASAKGLLVRANATTPGNLIEGQESGTAVVMAIDAKGRIAAGGATNAAQLFRAGGTHPDTATSVVGYGSSFTVPSTATTLAAPFSGLVTTAAASFTLASAYAFHANTPSLGAASAVTTSVGFRAETMGATGVANVYGVWVMPQSSGSTLNCGARIDATVVTLWLSGNADNTTASAGIFWGLSRDTNLYRRAANELRTDDKLLANLGIGVGNSAAATTPGTVTKKMEVFDAVGASLGFVPIYDAIT